ncbi:MAG TPA: tetratricopeptide repeat protein [Caulobacteraceae bacterium]|nr:tetratricopeptide repeat protein [Caulobacteraceae bacterium]
MDGDRHRNEGRWDEAAAAYAAGLKAKPNAFPYWVQYGHALKESGRFEAAEAAYLRAIALRGDEPDVRLQLGHLYKSTGRGDRALLCYAEAVEAGSTDRFALEEVRNARVRVSEPTPLRAFDAATLAILRRLVAASGKAKAGVHSSRAPSFARLILDSVGPATTEPRP